MHELTDLIALGRYGEIVERTSMLQSEADLRVRAEALSRLGCHAAALQTADYLSTGGVDIDIMLLKANIESRAGASHSAQEILRAGIVATPSEIRLRLALAKELLLCDESEESYSLSTPYFTHDGRASTEASTLFICATETLRLRATIREWFAATLRWHLSSCHGCIARARRLLDLNFVTLALAELGAPACDYEPLASILMAREALARQNLYAATAAIEQAISVEPRNVDALYWKGRILTAQERHEDARECFQECALIDVTYFQARAALLGLLAKLGKLQEALLLSEQLLVIRPLDPTVLSALALLRKAGLSQRSLFTGTREIIEQSWRWRPWSKMLERFVTAHQKR